MTANFKFTSLRSRCRAFFRPLRSAVPSLVGVLLGFALATGWDLWKTHRDQQAELFRAARAVYQELLTDIDLITANLKYLDTDISAAKANSEVVPPMSTIVTAAGDTAFLKGSFEYQSIEMATQLRKLYSSLDFINRRIEQREFYRFTNAAMSNFATRRVILDELIKNDLIAQQTAIGKFLDGLKKTQLVK